MKEKNLYKKIRTKFNLDKYCKAQDDSYYSPPVLAATPLKPTHMHIECVCVCLRLSGVRVLFKFSIHPCWEKRPKLGSENEEVLDGRAFSFSRLVMAQKKNKEEKTNF